MTAVWEALPASPCSATSGDSTLRTPRLLSEDPHAQVSLHTSLATSTLYETTNASPSLTQLTRASASTPPLNAKRARFESDPPRSDIASSAFVPAMCDSTDGHTALISPLNDAAGSDRRVELLERLKAITSKRAMLSGSTAANSTSALPCSYGSEVAVAVDEEVTFVQETAGLLPSERHKRRKTTCAKSATFVRGGLGASDRVIDVDNDDGDLVEVPPSPRKSGRASARKRGPRNISVASDQLAKRTSTRVRKSNRDAVKTAKLQPMPLAMQKCKRLQFCKKLITAMLRDGRSKPFSAPVSDLWHEHSMPRYFEVITRPMDLGTIKKNLESSLFLRPVKGDSLPHRFDVDKFANDVRLVFRNAMLYNRVGDPLHLSAKTLLDEFDCKLREGLPVLPSSDERHSGSPKKLDLKNRKGKGEVSRAGRLARTSLKTEPLRNSKCDEGGAVGCSKVRSKATSNIDFIESELETMSSSELKERLQYLESCREPVLARTPVPKNVGYLTRAALLYDVEMSWSQKVKCSEYISKVPEDKMEVLLDMVRSCTSVESGDDGIEFDMDNIDNKTLRNIEAFLETHAAGFKTIRSSSLGREFSTVGEVDEAIEEVRLHMKSAFLKKDEKEVGYRVSEEPKSFFEEKDVQDSSSSSDSSSGYDSGQTDSSDEDDSDSSG